MSVCWPVCSKERSVDYCQSHNVFGCKQEECLHFWSESQLRDCQGPIICTKSAAAGELQGSSRGLWTVVQICRSTGKSKILYYAFIRWCFSNCCWVNWMGWYSTLTVGITIMATVPFGVQEYEINFKMRNSWHPLGYNPLKIPFSCLKLLTKQISIFVIINPFYD